MSDEWCLTARLDGDSEEIALVVARVRELDLGGQITHDGATLRVYSDSEAQAARAEKLILGVIEATSLGYELWQERWDEEAGAWEELAPEDEEDERGG
jgi:hypothetical protein